MKTVQVIGTFISPYVRKVLACLDVKGIRYEIDPIVPFMGDDRFSDLSPLRRIPVLIDGNLTLSDSSVICQYLEDLQPSPALYPTGIADRARARWLEEYADSRMGEVIIWRLFNQRVIAPFVWGRATDEAVVARVLEQELPEVLGYLERQVPATGFLFGTLSIADISIASFFRNAAFARFAVDAARWPRTAAFVARVLAEPCFAKLAPIEDRMLRTRPAEQRSVLAAMGISLTPWTVGTTTPRPGLMKID